MFKDLSKVLIVTDLDGTLLSTDKALLDVDLNAIQRFKNAGGKFTVATGRTIQTTQRYIDELQLTIPSIMYNGALIYDTVKSEIIYKAELSSNARDIMRDVFDNIPDAAGEILTFDEVIVAKNNEYEDRHMKLCGITPIYRSIENVEDGGWIKMLFALDEKGLDKLVKFIDNKKYNGFEFVRSANIFYEVLPEGTSKGSALKHYREKCVFEDYTIVAAGDYCNDIDMLEYADLGAAPSNALDCVKEKADLVLDKTSDEGAIASLIDYIFECSAKENVG